MDLITTGVSASERMRRENLVSTIRNIIMEKMQLGGPSTRLLEVCEVCKLSYSVVLHASSKPLADFTGFYFLVT